MPSVLSVFLPGGVGSLSGRIYIADEGVTNLRQLYWPPGVNSLARHGSGYVYANRNYVMGAWSANLMIDENFRVLRQGIIPPQSPPTVGVGGGATDQICYVSFWDELTQQGSSISEGFAVTGNTTRAWSNLPTTVPGETAVITGTYNIAAGAVTIASGGGTGNLGQLRPGDRIADAAAPTLWAVIRTITDQDTATIDNTAMAAAAATLLHKPISRCTHLNLWVSVAGALPRLASRIPLGVSSFTESVGTLSLGEAFLENFEPPPFGTMNVTYGDRQVFAGNPSNPDTLYLSNLFEHEQWGGLSFKTRYGEPITGIVKMRDYLLVGTPASSYVLQGYTEDDLDFRGNEPDLGMLGHTTNIVVRGMAFIWNSQGHFMFNGSWHSILEDNLGTYQGIYQTYRREYETGIVVHDKAAHTIIFIPNYDPEIDYTTKTWFQKQNIIVWTCDYTGLVGLDAGGISQPNWGWDDHFVQGGEIKSGVYLAPTTTALGALYKVTTDGSVWLESPAVVGPNVIIVPAHLYFGDYGGDVQEGKELKLLYSYFYGDYANTNIKIFAGDAYAGGDDIQRRYEAAGLPGGASLGIPILYSPFSVDIPPSLNTIPTTPIPPSLSAETVTWAFFQARTVFSWKMNNTQPTGRGFTIRYTFSNHLILEWYGLGGYYGPGPAPLNLNWYESGG